MTLAIIFLLLYLTFRSGGEVLLVMLSLPFALVGGMITAPLLSLFVIPAIYLLRRQRGVRRSEPWEEGASVREAEPVPTG